MSNKLPKVIGHRGAKSVAPENTLASIRAAKALGCTWVEVDVMLTKDKEPVIHHDNTLDRCTNGSGNLWEYTLEEIERLDAGSHFSPQDAGERVPRLSALIECCRELSLGLNLEVKHVTAKSPDTPTPEEKAMEEELAHVVCDKVEAMNVQPGELVFSSFSRPAIAVLRKRLPQFNCAFLVEEIPDDWEEFVTEHQCVSLNFWWKHPTNTPEVIQACTRKILCYSYTVNDGDEANRLISLGVSGVFSDCPHTVASSLVSLGVVDVLTDSSDSLAISCRTPGVDLGLYAINFDAGVYPSNVIELPHGLAQA
jgi:glycerophosphoryl diester phosphodiesterase